MESESCVTRLKEKRNACNQGSEWGGGDGEVSDGRTAIGGGWREEERRDQTWATRSVL